MRPPISCATSRPPHPAPCHRPPCPTGVPRQQGAPRVPLLHVHHTAHPGHRGRGHLFGGAGAPCLPRLLRRWAAWAAGVLERAGVPASGNSRGVWSDWRGSIPLSRAAGCCSCRKPSCLKCYASCSAHCSASPQPMPSPLHLPRPCSFHPQRHPQHHRGRAASAAHAARGARLRPAAPRLTGGTPPRNATIDLYF